MKAGAAERVELARAVQPFKDVLDLARRASLTRHDLQVLAAAKALASVADNWRTAADSALLHNVSVDTRHPHSRRLPKGRRSPTIIVH